MKGGWLPRIDVDDGRDAPIYERVLAALREDIRAGVLIDGSPLPPQRKLASSLGLSTGTISRAYREAEAEGLISAHVGRGTVVISPRRERAAAPAMVSYPAATGGAVNLARNEPPIPLTAAVVGAALRDDGLSLWMEQESGYASAQGRERHREAMVAWLAALGVPVEARDMVLCSGAQHALSLTLRALCDQRQDTVLVEANTYPGFVALTASLGLATRPVAMDAEGIDPDALERVAREHAGAVLYTMPTLHNPTTRTQSLERREAIVAVARRHDLTLLEDDVYRALLPDAPTALFTLAPERTVYVSSLSKVLAPSLRTGCLVAGSAPIRARITRQIYAEAITGTSASSTLASFILRSGLAQGALERLLADTRNRLALVAEVFADDVEYESADAAFHLWLPMSRERAEQVCSDALRESIAVTPPDARTTDAERGGLRVCIGGCTMDELRASFETLKSLLV